MLGLVTPLAGVHNLDVSPDALSDTSGARQIWGQLTPSADDSFLSASIPEAEPSAVRSYRCEEDMYDEKSQKTFDPQTRLLMISK
jgi:hypothetical protein